MMVDIIITHRGAPGFSASAVRNPLVKGEPSTQNEAAAKNGFQPSFCGAKTHFQNPKVPPGWGSSDGGLLGFTSNLAAVLHTLMPPARAARIALTFTLGPL